MLCDVDEESVSSSPQSRFSPSQPRIPPIQSESSGPIWRPESFQDGFLEVCSVQGSLHLAQIQLGIVGADRLRQGQQIVITVGSNNMKMKIPVQVDGEPWLESCGCKFTIQRYECAQLLQYTSGNKFASIATEVVDWGYRSGVLNADQKQKMLSECSKRLEHRHRASSTD